MKQNGHPIDQPKNRRSGINSHNAPHWAAPVNRHSVSHVKQAPANRASLAWQNTHLHGDCLDAFMNEYENMTNGVAPTYFDFPLQMNKVLDVYTPEALLPMSFHRQAPLTAMSPPSYIPEHYRQHSNGLPQAAGQSGPHGNPYYHEQASKTQAVPKSRRSTTELLRKAGSSPNDISLTDQMSTESQEVPVKGKGHKAKGGKQKVRVEEAPQKASPAIDPNFLLTMKLIDPTFDMKEYFDKFAGPGQTGTAHPKGDLVEECGGLDDRTKQNLKAVFREQNFVLKTIEKDLNDIKSKRERDERKLIDARIKDMEKKLNQKTKEEKFERFKDEILKVG